MTLDAVSASTNPRETVVKPKTISVPERLNLLAEQVAKFRNLMAEKSGRPLRLKWSAKSVLEAWVEVGAAADEQTFREMFEKVGPFPHLKDEDALEQYVERARHLEPKPSK